MIVLGLTGSIGMGKSTTAQMFRDAGIPVWDADATVHQLYGPNAAGTAAIASVAPGAVTQAGVDRAKLRDAILADSGLLKIIETKVHPLVSADRSDFLEQCRLQNEPIAVCDIPLLFETGAEQWLDKVLVVTASPETQRNRVMDRPGMTPEIFETILAKQVPDRIKRLKADHVIETDHGMDAARQAVAALIDTLKGQPHA